MKLWLIMAAALVLMAAKETDFPHRPWGKVATLDMTLQDAQACVARELDKRGSVLVLPTEAGAEIDYTLATSLLTGSGEAMLRVTLTKVERGVSLGMKYRRPFSVKIADGLYRKMEKACLKVSGVAAEG